MSGSARPPTQPGETAVFTQLVVFPPGVVHSRRPCHLWSSIFSLSCSSTSFLRSFVSPDIYWSSSFGACWVLHDGSKVAKVKLVPSCSANLCASFTSEENPFSHAFSSNIHTPRIIGSGFSRKRKLSVLTMAGLPSLISGGEGLTHSICSRRSDSWRGAR